MYPARLLSYKANARSSLHSPQIISLLPLSLATDVTDATLGASGLWLGIRTGAGGTATLTKSFLATVHDSMVNRSGTPLHVLELEQDM